MSKTPDTGKADDFFAAAARQKKIETQVKARGEAARPELERQSAIEQGDSALQRLQQQEDKQRQLDDVIAYVDAEIGTIISALASLPEDADQRRFAISRTDELCWDGLVTIDCHYATAKEATALFILAETDTPAFRIMFLGSRSGSAQNKPPYISFHDYSRMTTTGTTTDPTKIRVTDSKDLRAVIGAFVARAAPHRLDDIAAALSQPTACTTNDTTGVTDDAPATLSQAVILRAPRLASLRTAADTPAAPAAQPEAKEKPFFKRLFRR